MGPVGVQPLLEAAVQMARGVCISKREISDPAASCGCRWVCPLLRVSSRMRSAIFCVFLLMQAARGVFTPDLDVLPCMPHLAV